MNAKSGGDFLRNFTVLKGQRFSDILILVRFLLNFARIKITVWSLYFANFGATSSTRFYCF